MRAFDCHLIGSLAQIVSLKLKKNVFDIKNQLTTKRICGLSWNIELSYVA